MNRLLLASLLILMIAYLGEAQNTSSLTTLEKVHQVLLDDHPTFDNLPMERPAIRTIKPFKCKIFPAQVKSSLQVHLPLTDNFTLRLVDASGNILFTHMQIFGENHVNLGHLKADRYYVEITSDKGKIVEEIVKT